MGRTCNKDFSMLDQNSELWFKENDKWPPGYSVLQTCMIASSTNSIKDTEMSFENGLLHLEQENSQLNCRSGGLLHLDTVMLISNFSVGKRREAACRQTQTTKENFLTVLIVTQGNKASYLVSLKLSTASVLKRADKVWVCLSKPILSMVCKQIWEVISPAKSGAQFLKCWWGLTILIQESLAAVVNLSLFYS